MSAPLPKTAIVPTREQQDVLIAARSLRPGELLKIQARAGTGKTSTLELLARADDRAMLYLAFNADVNAAAKKRFPGHVTCKTTHGLAFVALGIHQWIPEKGAPRSIRGWEMERWLKTRRWNPELKTGATLADVSADMLATVRAFMQSADRELTRDHARCTRKATRFTAFETTAKTENPDRADLAQRNAHDSYARYRDWLAEKAGHVWQTVTNRSDASLPLEHDAYLKLYQLQRPTLNYAVVLLDEAQDTNPCVMDLFLNQTAAKIMVGDEAQAIYGFRGAVDALKTPGHERPLLKSFRFGPAIADVANCILAFKASYWQGFHALRGFAERQSEIGVIRQPPYAVICRGNKGVFMAAVNAAQAGLSINSGAKDLEDSILLVETAWALLVKHRLEKRHADLADFPDWDALEQESQSDCSLQWLVKLVCAHREDMSEVCEKLRAAKTRMKKSADVLVITAHKSKGLEFDQVVLADDFDALDKPLKQAIEKPLDAESILESLPDQELHLLYVAATRAQFRLQPNQTLMLMEKLTGVLSRIRDKHSIHDPLPPAAITTDAAPTADGMTPETARLLFAAFPAELRVAMKTAATRYAWCAATWPLQIEIINDALLAGHSADDLAIAYSTPVEMPHE
jgi:hypothetical protein